MCVCEVGGGGGGGVRVYAFVCVCVWGITNTHCYLGLIIFLTLGFRLIAIMINQNVYLDITQFITIIGMFYATFYRALSLTFS